MRNKALIFLFASIFLSLSFPRQAISMDSARPGAEQEEAVSFPEWAERGAYVYGIAVFFFPDGRTVGHAIHARIILATEDRMQLRALESVTQSRHEACTAMGVNYGDTWWEDNPDELFQTREEAEAYLKEKGWL